MKRNGIGKLISCAGVAVGVCSVGLVTSDPQVSEGRTLTPAETSRIWGGQVPDRACDIATYCLDSLGCGWIAEEACEEPFATQTDAIPGAKNKECVAKKKGIQCKDDGEQNDCAIIVYCEWEPKTKVCYATTKEADRVRAAKNCVQQQMPGG